MKARLRPSHRATTGDIVKILLSLLRRSTRCEQLPFALASVLDLGQVRMRASLASASQM